MAARPRVLDLFCGSGGAGMGYYRAGFDVVGVDINPQPNYPFKFIQADAMEYVRKHKPFDVIHASPPCQHHTRMAIRNGNATDHPLLIPMLRMTLQSIGKPYVIENVVGAPLMDPVQCCGTSFGKPLQRHRLFESNVLRLVGTTCRHDEFPKNIPVINHGHTLTQFVPVYGSGGGKARHLWQDVMDMPWTNVTKELAEAIPPYFTEWIGRQVIAKMNEVDDESAA